MRTRICSNLLLHFCLGFLTLPRTAVPARAQTRAPGQWTWMGGSNTGGQPGVYGALGTPAPGNIPPSRRITASSVDNNGHVWLFGGSTQDYEMLNDLWEFDPSTNEWVWRSGSNLPNQSGNYGPVGIPNGYEVPGPRAGAAGWSDGDGNFWIFGGFGAGSLNELWEFRPSTGEWTFWGGSFGFSGTVHGFPGVYGTLGLPDVANLPGSRIAPARWTDRQGDLWLFGGDGYDINDAPGDLSDLWMFNPSTDEWTWIGGTNVSTNDFGYIQDYGTYGELGVPSAENHPGARYDAATSTDTVGNVWLFGGSGSSATQEYVRLNDLWEFDQKTGEWTWISGSTQGEQPGVYGTLGLPSPANTPGARYSASIWVDTSGNVWLFGGEVPTPASGHLDFYFNDLWEFGATTWQWTWMGGSNAANAAGGYPGAYGVLGSPASLNYPGSRSNQVSWTDSNGNLWLFGGQGYDSSGTENALNDVWEYQPAIAATPTFTPTTGSYTSAQSVTVSDTTPGATIYYTLDGTTPSALSTPYTGPFFVITNQTVVKAIATAPGYAPSTLASALYTLTVAAPTFSLASGTYTTGQTVAIGDSTVGSTIHYTVDGTTPTTSSPVYASPITVAQTETVQAIAVENGFSTSAVASASYTIPPDFSMSINPILISVPSGQSGTALIIVQSEFGFNSTVSFACSGLPQGASCSFSPVSTSSSPGMDVTTMTISTSTSTSMLRPFGSPLYSGPTLAVAFCFIGFRKRRRVQKLLLLVVGLMGLCALGGCGGSSKPTLSVVTVTGTSGSVQHAVTLDLIVH